ncbi:protein HGH1 homolog [Gigantopelta aegis]|uniref:protein HGH1 homolog n=1 Tax=Gigantopelta aegis TaxID=1735272 RepID=UPI001B88DD5A|nr:protein HGH1 homolog [Gigantopelta aegis]XP_041348917.1 protein HGH1 homolog [Gigantopelta aegis]XP_041348918.1 protein HGH1 homolog [Gigantopelta aegis]XP_041348919.1 protein HGH1 homolog [Gigantopelta aegis]
MDASTTEKMEKEILPFLNRSARPDVKSIALEYFLGMTGSEDGRKFIASGNGYLGAIVSLTTDSQQGIAKSAYFSLVNLMTEEDTAWYVLNMKEYPNLCLSLLQYVVKPDSDHADIVASILSNMTRSQRCAVKVAEVVSACTDNDQCVSLEKIIQTFCKLEHNPKANLHYVATILMNLTQVPTVRHKMMDKQRLLLQRLLPFTEFSDSKIRRAGIIGVLKNCCFETDFHEWLLGDHVDILPRLLLPLAGPEEFDDDDMEKLPDDLQYLPPDKQRESDPDIRKMLIEAITQLCATRAGRKHIKDKNTYVIMRELHKWEKDKGCDIAISKLIDVLIADEPPEGMDNLKEMQIPDKLKVMLDEEYAKTQAEIEDSIKQEMETENVIATEKS